MEDKCVNGYGVNDGYGVSGGWLGDDDKEELLMRREGDLGCLTWGG